MPRTGSERETHRDQRQRRLQTLAFTGGAVLLSLVLALSIVSQRNQRAEERRAATATAQIQATGTAVAENAATAEAETQATQTAFVEKVATVEARATARAASREQYPVVGPGTPFPLPGEAIAPWNASLVAELARWGKGWVNEIAWSADGRLLAVATTIGVYLYDAHTLEEVRYLETQSWATSAAFSPDGTLLAAIDLGDSKVHLWDAEAGQQVGVLEAPFIAALDVAFSPDGSLLAAGSASGQVALWNTATKQVAQTLKGGDDPVYRLTFSSDGTLLAAGSQDGGTLWLWDLSNALTSSTPIEPEIHVPAGHSEPLSSLILTPDSTLIISCPSGGAVRFWEVETGQSVELLPELTGPVFSAALSPDGALLAVALDDGTVELWELAAGKRASKLEGSAAPMANLAFSPDGAFLAAAAFPQWPNVRLWETETGRQVGVLEEHAGLLNCVTFSPDGSLLASGSTDGLVRLWEVATGEMLRVLEGHTGSVGSLVFSPDGTFIVAGTGGRPMRIWIRSGLGKPGVITAWDVETGENVPFLRELTDEAYGITLSPDGAFLAATVCQEAEQAEDEGFTCRESRVLWWDIASLRNTPAQPPLGAFDARGSLGNPVFSPDGALLATGGEDGIIRVWDIATRQEVRAIGAPSDPVDYVAFSPDGTLLASAGCDDASVQLWDVRTGEQVERLWPTRVSWIIDLAFSPSGDLLVVGTLTSAQLFAVEGARTPLIELPRENIAAVIGVAVSPDGTLLATAGPDGTVRLWGIPP